MILFSFRNKDTFERDFRKGKRMQSGRFEVSRFANGEMYVTVKSNVKRKPCVILGTMAPPDENMMQVLMLAHTLKKEGARRVTAVLPYLAYSRHDKLVPGQSLATEWIGRMIKASGVDKIVTLDLHSDRDNKLIPVPIANVPVDDLFAQVACSFGLEDATVVAPDHGALKRCRAFKKAAGIKAPLARFEKRRTARGITHSGPFGKVGERVILCDDMIDTGETLVLACEKLVRLGVKDIYVMATHGLFTGTKWKRLWKLRVRNVFTTDSVLGAPKDRRIHIVRGGALMRGIGSRGTN